MAAATPKARDPVPELLGWDKYDLLRKRMKLYLWVSICEVQVLALALAIMHMRRQTPTSLRALLPPLIQITLGIVVARCLWIGCLVWGYYRVKGSDLQSAIRRMGALQSRSCWSFSEVACTCGAIFLMVWYCGFAVLLLIQNHLDNCREVNLIAGMFFLFAAAYYSIWKDTVQHLTNEEYEPSDEWMVHIYNLYRSGSIKIAAYQELIQTRSNVPSTCCVCLEDFSEDGEIAKLPCGHVFHPLCSHTWIRDHCNCPLRCDLKLGKSVSNLPTHAGDTRPREPTERERLQERIQEAVEATAGADLEAGMATHSAG